MSEVSAFDPVAFLSTPTTEVNEERPKIPADFYTAVVGEIDLTKVKTGAYSKGERVGQPWMSLPVPLKLQLPPEVQSLGLPPEFQLTDHVFIDLTPSGGMDNAKGKNRRQLDYRKATNMNNPGEPFAWPMLQGRPLKVQVTHEIYEGRVQERLGVILPA